MDLGRGMMGMERRATEGRRVGWEVRLDKSMDVSGERGDAVFCTGSIWQAKRE